MEAERIAPEELAVYFGSKQDMYQVFTIDRKQISLIMKYSCDYLPGYLACPTEFLRDLWSKKKKALHYKDVHFICVPKYPELSVHKIWPYVKQDEELCNYFPNFEGNKLPEREYMWNVLYTLRQDAACELIRQSRENRSVSSTPSSEDLVEIAPDLLQKLKELRPQKRHKEKIAFMIKGCAKLNRTRQQPRRYNANYSVILQDSQERDHEQRNEQPPTRSSYYNTVEMMDEDEKAEEEKEEIKQNQNSAPFRRSQNQHYH